MRTGILLASCVLALGMACFKRDVIAPLVYEPQDGEEATVLGNVRDARTGEPLVGAEVALWNTESHCGTDLGGRYWITSPRPGLYTLIVSYPGYSDKRRLVKMKPGQTTAGIDFRLRRYEIDFGHTVESGSK